MLLIHQTFMKFTKFQKYFCVCVQWQKHIEISQTLLRFDLNFLFLGGPNTQQITQSGLKLET